LSQKSSFVKKNDRQSLFEVEYFFGKNISENRIKTKQDKRNFRIEILLTTRTDKINMNHYLQTKSDLSPSGVVPKQRDGFR